MMSPIKLGLGIHWRAQPIASILDLIDGGERLGFDSLWIANDRFYHDMYVTATMAAMRTSRARIGTFIADPYSLHPALTAAAIATLDEVSNGRAVLGIGAGGTGFPELGIDRKKPARAIGEAIELIKKLLRGESVVYQGEIIGFNGGRLGFKARPDIPVIVGSRGDKVYRQAGRVADGVMIATFAEPIGIHHAKSVVAKGAADAGRPLDELTFISRIDTCIHTDRRVAIKAVKHGVAICLWASYPDRSFVKRLGLEIPTELEAAIAKRDYGLIDRCADLVPDEFVPAFAWAGTVDEVAAQVLRVVREAKITNLTIMPIPAPGQTPLDVAEAFAAKVRPLVENTSA